MDLRRALVAASIAVAATNVVFADTHLARVLYEVTAGVAILVLWRAPRRAGGDRRAWQLLALGLACWYAGDLFWDSYAFLGRERPAVSIADVWYLAGYPALAAGIGRMVACRAPGEHREGLLDGLAFAAAAVVASWQFLIVPNTEGASLGQAVVWGAYPIGDLLLLAAASWLVLTPGRRGTPTAMVVAFLVVTLVADVAYMVIPLHWPGASLAPFDAVYLLSYVTLALAATHPDADELTEAAPPSSHRMHPARVVLLGVALVTAPFMAVVSTKGESVGGEALLVVASVACAAIVLARFTIAVRQREAAHEELARRASRDELTGLHNRPVLMDRAARTLDHARSTGRMVGVLYVDIDRFKAVNDTWGHDVGDAVLRETARRLRAAVRDADTIARVGGDEFVVVLQDVSGVAEVEAAAERIRELLAAPLEVGNVTATLSASVGVTIGPGASEVERLLRDADVAMYRAKQRGRNRTERYDEALHELLARRAEIEAGLRRAIAADELRVHYQPIVDVSNGTVHGFEALMRWQRPGVGMVEAGSFIDIAEESGLVVPMGKWVLDAACRQLARWNAEAPRLVPLWVAVNVSPRQFAAGDFADGVERALMGAGTRPEHLVLEITESMLVHDFEHTTSQLERLRALGVRIAVDDFGTGYSALAYLRQFPIDIVKLDRHFLAEIDTVAARDTMVGAVIQLAHTLGHVVVAEGVEERHQADALAQMDCDFAQGFHFAEALAPEYLRTVVVTRSTRPEVGLAALA